MSFLARLGASMIVAIILSVLAESEHCYLLIIGTAIVGWGILSFVHENSTIGALWGDILFLESYFIYQIIWAFMAYIMKIVIIFSDC